MTTRIRGRRDERGAVAVMVATMAVALFVIAALVVDLGLARDTKRRSQIASDASALAAANVLYPASEVCTTPAASAPPCFSDAVTAATSYAAVNYGVTAPMWTGCADASALVYRPNASNPCVSFNSTTAPTRVRVRLPDRTVNTGLGTLAGVESITISAPAVAGARKAENVTCGLCFTGSISTKKFKAQVDAGSIAVSGFVDMHPGGVPWTATAIQYGGASFAGPIPSSAVKKIDPFSDPWASKTGLPPSVASLTTRASGADPCTAGPGIYDTYEFKHDCTFSSGGLYVFTGPLLSKNVTITAPGVTLYFTCGTRTAPQVCTGGPGSGYLDLKNGDLRLTAPTSGALAQLGIVYDRLNSSPMDLQGNGISTVVGSIYAPSSTLNYNGTSDVVVSGGPIILDAMTGNGTTGVWVKNSTDATIKSIPGEVALAE